MRALVAIGDPLGVSYVLGCAQQVVSKPDRDDSIAVMGCIAIDALGSSADVAIHEQLIAWVIEIGSGAGWDSVNIWHLLDAAKPYLDGRALPVVTALLSYLYDHDVVSSARSAIAEIHRKSPLGGNDHPCQD
jgi:hypothetical protein